MDKDWLKQLKVGDKVFINSTSNFGKTNWALGEVKEISKANNIKVTMKSTGQDIIFNSKGIERIHYSGKFAWVNKKYYLTQYTLELHNERIEANKYYRLIKKLNDFDFSTLTRKKLDSINNIINEV